MFACLYLLLAWAAGRVIYRRFWGVSGRLEFAGLPSWSVREPAAFIIGILLLTWITYLTAYLARTDPQPLFWGNCVSFVLGFGILILNTVWRTAPAERPSALSATAIPNPWIEGVLAFGSVILFGWLCQRVFQITEDGAVRAGVSVFSDYGPHVAVIRSFSHGHNFPTEYPHFPDGDARYHFMFQFLCGNLEYLGLRLDYAFNLPSALAFGSCVLLLHALTTRITGSRLAGIIAVVLFFFRTGTAAYDFAQGTRTFAGLLEKFWSNDQFIGTTRHEDWGLWNQNVYLNQRHLLLGLSVLLLTLLVMYPLLHDMALRLRQGRRAGEGLRGWLRNFAGTTTAWLPTRGQGTLQVTVGAGIVLGAAGFWNGAAVIGTLVILFACAFFSARRLDFLIVATIAGGLCYAQNKLFIKPGVLAVSPEWVWGFLAEPPVTWKSVAEYIQALLGVMPWFLGLGLLWHWCAGPWRSSRAEGDGLGLMPGRLTVIFLAPFILAFTVKLTPDIAINHKYVMIAVILLNLLIAGWISRVIGSRRPLPIAVAVVALLPLTATGIIDFRTILNKDKPELAIVASLNEPVLKWIEANTDPSSILLTDWFSYHAILLSGRKIYYGWPYYAWGAGYDTRAREEVVKRIYGGTDPDDIRRAVSEARIRYIVIDDANRQQKLYTLQEERLKSLYPVVFTDRDVSVLQVR